MSDLIDIFKEAIIYPLNNIIVLLILGLIFVICNLSSILGAWGIDINNGSIILILLLVSFVLMIVVLGYSLSVIKDAINYNVSIPQLDFVKNFVDGIKIIVLEIIYYIIPAILTLIVGFISGTFSSAMNIIMFVADYQNNMTVVNSTVPANDLTVMLNAIPQEYIGSLFTGLAITAIVGIILFIIFGLLFEIALCRLAKYDSLGEALRFGEVFGDIKRIGIGKYIGWYILLIIIVMILAIIVSLISMIPYIGILLSFLICSPFIFLFTVRSLGLLYMGAE